MVQRELIGQGAISSLPALIGDHHARSVFLLHGRSSFESSGISRRVTSLLSPFSVTRWSEFSPNPTVDDLEKGLELFRRSDCDSLVSIGGGSVMDMGKLIKYFSDAQDTPAVCLTENRTPGVVPDLPHISAPTTSGSGSEATHFAVLYLNGVKHSVADPALLPEAAIIDPELSSSMPARQTAISGMDALSQAVESYWSIHSTEESTTYAREALQAILPNIETAVLSPGPRNRERMAVGAHLAGKAINITKTTAPHAISYTLTSRFGIPHGHAVALTLGAILAHNAGVGTDDASDPRGVDFTRRRIGELCSLLGGRNPEECRTLLRDLMKKIGLAADLASLGIRSTEDLTAILDGVNPQRLQNNPRTLSREMLKTILLNL